MIEIFGVLNYVRCPRRSLHVNANFIKTKTKLNLWKYTKKKKKACVRDDDFKSQQINVTERKRERRE